MPPTITDEPITDEPIRARDSAVAVHDRTAAFFVSEYQDPESHHHSAFRYGRALIDAQWLRTAEAALRSPGDEALDIGCGIGIHLERLLAGGRSAIGVEPSAAMRARAVERLGDDRVVPGSVLSLDFPGERFAFAYAIEVLRYLDAADNARGHREIHRVLRPGGVYFGTYVNRFALDGFAPLVRWRRLRHRLGGPAPACHVEAETPRSIAAKLRAAGFAEVRVIGAMVAPLRPLYKLAPGLARRIAPAVMRWEPWLSDRAALRALAGHLIVVARK